MLAAGFVLVGGRSERMGRDKARLPVSANFLVDEVARQVRSAAATVALVGQAERYRDLPYDCFDDLRPGAGPLGGIETALGTARGDLNLIVACDMPGLRSEWLQDLVGRAAKRASRCLICRDVSGRVHPLCGIWSPDCLPVVQRALDEKRLRLHDVLHELAADYLTIDCPIWNVNTPAEWREWQHQHRSRSEARQ